MLRRQLWRDGCGDRLTQLEKFFNRQPVSLFFFWDLEVCWWFQPGYQYCPRQSVKPAEAQGRVTAENSMTITACVVPAASALLT